MSRHVQVFRAYQRRSDEWPGCEYRDDRQANRAARAAGPERGIRVTHGYAGHRCDGHPPWPPATPTVPMAARRAYPAPHSDTRLARRIRRAWEGTLLIPAGRTNLTLTGRTHLTRAEFVILAVAPIAGPGREGDRREPRPGRSGCHRGPGSTSRSSPRAPVRAPG